MIFGGRFRDAAREGYQFAVSEGFRGFGPGVYGELMSWGKDAWVFQSSIAQRLGCSVRTVQRWLRRYRDEGLVRCWRGKRKEKPPGAKAPVTCGWSHRILTAWHAAGVRFRELREQLIARREAKRTLRARGQGMTAEQIDRELLRRYGPEPPE